jgi:transcription elongation GreA/GreB family factor
MNKTAIVQAIVDALREECEARQRSSRQTRSAGNDAETKAEGKYDTRSTEENYLADGLARQAHEAAQAAAAYEKLVVRDFEPGEKIDLGALVRVGFADADEWFFLGPAGGGIEVTVGKLTTTVITPESPLGAQLMGRSAGAKLSSPRAEVKDVL